MFYCAHIICHDGWRFWSLCLQLPKRHLLLRGDHILRNHLPLLAHPILHLPSNQRLRQVVRIPLLRRPQHQRLHHHLPGRLLRQRHNQNLLDLSGSVRHLHRLPGLHLMHYRILPVPNQLRHLMSCLPNHVLRPQRIRRVFPGLPSAILRVEFNPAVSTGMSNPDLPLANY